MENNNLIKELYKLYTKDTDDWEYWKQTNLRQTLRAITPPKFALAFYKANL